MKTWEIVCLALLLSLLTFGLGLAVREYNAKPPACTNENVHIEWLRESYVDVLSKYNQCIHSQIDVPGFPCADVVYKLNECNARMDAAHGMVQEMITKIDEIRKGF